MKWFSKAAVGGLLWLSFGAAFGDTLYITGLTENVLEGGQFSAYLNDPSQQLVVYCADYRNAEGTPDTVNISTPLSLADIAATRYGTTPTASFSYYTSAPALTALDRYVLAGWLTTQYNFTSGVTLADEQIQNAIWSLLTTAGNGGFPFGDALGTGTWITQSETWKAAAALNGTLTSFESSVRIYTSTNVAGNNDLTQDAGSRYNTGMQEMIGTVPEPDTIAMMGIGLLGIGLYGRRRLKA